jgi:hypothetical protein
MSRKRNANFQWRDDLRIARYITGPAGKKGMLWLWSHVCTRKETRPAYFGSSIFLHFCEIHSRQAPPFHAPTRALAAASALQCPAAIVDTWLRSAALDTLE